MECEERQEVREGQARERELRLLCHTGGEAQDLPAIHEEDGQTAGVEQTEELDPGVMELLELDEEDSSKVGEAIE